MTENTTPTSGDIPVATFRTYTILNLVSAIVERIAWAVIGAVIAQVAMRMF